MSTESRHPADANAIEAAASAWLVQRDSAMWSEDDQRRFRDWLSASTLHRVAYLRLEAAWQNAARLKAIGAGVPGDKPPPRGQWNLGPFFESRPIAVKRGWAAWRAALAAMVLLALGFGGYLAFSDHGERFSTVVGRIESIPLPEGSKIILNTDSEIRVLLTRTERRVELQRGEAFFQVAKDAKRPFVVVVGGKRVIAVGTQFSVRRDSNSVEVAVTEGQVRVGQSLLTPGTIAHAGDAGILVQRASVPQVEERLSWRSGMLRFRDEPLGSAIAEFNRYNERKIVIADPAVAALKIEGDFRPTNVDAFVRLLQSGFPVHVTDNGAEIVLTSSEAVTRP